MPLRNGTDDYEVRGDFDRRRFTRKELTQMKLRSEWLSRQPNQNPSWVRAYQNLCSAADTLDAMIYRAVGVAKERMEEEDRDTVEGHYDLIDEEV